MEDGRNDGLDGGLDGAIDNQMDNEMVDVEMYNQADDGMDNQMYDPTDDETDNQMDDPSDTELDHPLDHPLPNQRLPTSPPIPLHLSLDPDSPDYKTLKSLIHDAVCSPFRTITLADFLTSLKPYVGALPHADWQRLVHWLWVETLAPLETELAQLLAERKGEAREKGWEDDGFVVFSEIPASAGLRFVQGGAVRVKRARMAKEVVQGVGRVLEVRRRVEGWRTGVMVNGFVLGDVKAEEQVGEKVEEEYEEQVAEKVEEQAGSQAATKPKTRKRKRVSGTEGVRRSARVKAGKVASTREVRGERSDSHHRDADTK